MVTLTDDHRAILDVLGDGGRSIEDLSTVIEAGHAAIEGRLDTLEENGLVEETGSDWTLTEDGRRVLEAPGDGSADERIDTPEQVEAVIETLQLRPDREDAVRSAYVFLGRRGRAVSDEIRDAVFDEHPCSYDDSERWWDNFVAENLSSLPGIVSPEDPEEPWRYTEENGNGASLDATKATREPTDESRDERAAATDSDDRCPVCGTAYSGTSFHLTPETIVPARNHRSCVRASATEEGLGITIYYHGRWE